MLKFGDFIIQSISAFFTGLKNFLNGVSNTIWGLIIVFVTMRMILHGTNESIVYYFAGIGSTLLGISQHGQTSNITNSTVKLPAAINQGAENAEG